MQIAGILSRSRGEYLAAASFFTNYHPILSRSLGSSRGPHLVLPSPLQSTISNIFGPTSGCERAYHYGRPRGSLWRGKKEIGKEALFVILGMKRFKDDGEKLDKFIKTHVRRLLKLDMVAVLNELERQGEVSLAVKVDSFILGRKAIKEMVCESINHVFKVEQEEYQREEFQREEFQLTIQPIY